MKNIDSYTRQEIIKCLKAGTDTYWDDLDTETLRELLSDLIASGDCPEIEYFEGVNK